MDNAPRRRIKLPDMTVEEAVKYLMEEEHYSKYRAIERAEMEILGILPAIHPRARAQRRQGQDG
jgi:hypothetical protein